MTTEQISSSISRRALVGSAAGAAAAAVLGVAGAAGAATVPAGGAKPARRSQFLMGLNTHMTGPKYIPDAVKVLKELGGNAIRDQILWSTVEKQAGVYEVPADVDAFIRDAAAAGLDPVLILDYGNPLYDGGERPTSPEGVAAFTKYARFLARHFAGVVSKWEVWNEWDIPIGGVTGNGDPIAYLNLIKAVYPALKEIDRNLTVVGGSVSTLVDKGYTRTLLENGLLDYCDVFSIHTYVYADLPVETRSPEAWLDRMLALRATLREYTNGVDFPVYITETGWTTGFKNLPDEPGVTQELQAAHCARLFLLARTLPFLEGLWLYEFQDEGWTYNIYGTNWGLVRPDLTAKEGYFAFRSIADIVTQGRYVGRQAATDGNVWALRFKDRTGSDVMALWNSYPDNDYSVVLHNKGAKRRPLVVQQAGGVPMTRRWGRRPWYDQSGAAFIPDDLDVTLRRTPVLISGQLDDIEITQVLMHPFPERQR